MKKWAISLCLLVLLTGCDPAPDMDRGMALRTAVLSAQQCNADVRITADYGDSVCRFFLGCSFDQAGNMSFSVLQPESIEGIKGSISSDTGRILFDDTVLYFDLLADGQLSPICAPWIFMKALRSGYLRAVCREEAYLQLTIDDSFSDDALQVDIWADSENIPVHAEILFKGHRILSMKIENFHLM